MNSLESHLYGLFELELHGFSVIRLKDFRDYQCAIWAMEY